MPSAALEFWLDDRKAALDEIEAAHRSVGGTAPGRRYATQQINHAYAVLLSSHFQGYCRDLHSECLDCLVPPTLPFAWATIVRGLLVQGRKLDTGNPNPGNIGSDFNKFGFKFWDRVAARSSKNRGRQAALEKLVLWRNAIAHQDFTKPELGTSALKLVDIRGWRKVCNRFVTDFDAVMAEHIESITGQLPW